MCGQGSSQMLGEAMGAHKFQMRPGELICFTRARGAHQCQRQGDITNVLWGQGSSQMSGEARGAHKCQLRLGELTNFRWGQGSSYISSEARGAHKCEVSCHGWDVGKAVRKTTNIFAGILKTEDWRTWKVRIDTGEGLFWFTVHFFAVG